MTITVKVTMIPNGIYNSFWADSLKRQKTYNKEFKAKGLPQTKVKKGRDFEINYTAAIVQDSEKAMHFLNFVFNNHFAESGAKMVRSEVEKKILKKAVVKF